MKDKQARALAIVALVFMGIFVASLVATFIDASIFNGGIGYIALCSAVFALMIFIALKADGRGYSVTKMRNESELKKIEDALKAQENDRSENEETDVEDTEVPDERSDDESSADKQSEDGNDN